MNKRIFSIINWNSFRKVFSNTFHFKYNSIESVSDFISSKSESKDWKICNDWEDLDDLTLLEMLREEHYFCGELHIITEASYHKLGGPFKVNSFTINNFVASHLKIFKECFFNGDVIIINFHEKCIWLFHHEGVYIFHKIIGVRKL